MKGNFQKLKEKVRKMVTEKQFEQILEESKNKMISNSWLEVSLIATNADGLLSKEIDPEKYNDSEYPDVVQEIQSWVAKLVTAKRIEITKRIRIKKKLKKLIKEVEETPSDLISIFYKHRYIFKKHKNHSKINNHE